jgi:hypothetical protein
MLTYIAAKFLLFTILKKNEYNPAARRVTIPDRNTEFPRMVLQRYHYYRISSYNLSRF